jgi:hypothetical protein
VRNDLHFRGNFVNGESLAIASLVEGHLVRARRSVKRISLRLRDGFRTSNWRGEKATRAVIAICRGITERSAA